MANYTSTQTAVQSLTQTLFKSLYMQMAAALTITGLTAYFLSESAAFWRMLADNQALIWVIIIAQVGLVLWLTMRLHKMSMTTATLLFIAYSVLTGVSLSSIFIIYTKSSIASTFFITAGTFAVMSLIGYTTKRDLTKLGSILLMLLIGIIIATLVNIFLHSEGLYWAITYIGVAVFVGLIAWDTQKIKNIFEEHGTADDNGQKLALMGALMLYLDFINLFIYLLRLLGNRE